MSFEDLLKDLQGQKAKQEDPNNESFEKMFDASFMRAHSTCQSFPEFMEKGNFQGDTQEEIDMIPEELFNRHVDRETDFTDWKSMLEAARIRKV